MQDKWLFSKHYWALTEECGDYSLPKGEEVNR
jgi:hypothetical protein